MPDKNPDSIPRYEQPMDCYTDIEEYEACEDCELYFRFSKADQKTICGQLSPYGARLGENERAIRDVMVAVRRCGFCPYRMGVVACDEHACDHYREA